MTQVIIISGTSWIVPADWNSADNSVEAIGGGGGGGTSSGGNDAGGGGGGAYSKVTNLELTREATVAIQVGVGGQPHADGGDTWFNGTSLAASSVGARGGRGASGITGGTGGDQASGTGSIKFSGGNGGSSTNSQNGGAGGGGAAGRNGTGKPGALSGGNYGSGGGGAGGGSSAPGSDGSGSVGGTGGDGPEGHSAAPGGAGAVPGSSIAVSGSRGSGGGGGATGGSAGQAAGASGGAGIEFDGSHGSGGGGGGGGYSNASNANGGPGGLYGGGGGGTAYAPGLGVGGTGAQGIIVINYTPTVALGVTANTWLPLESKGTVCYEKPDPVQFLASIYVRNADNPVECLARGSGERRSAMQASATANSAAYGYALESVARMTCAAGPAGEVTASLGGDARLSFGALSVLGRHQLSSLESLTDGARISTAGPTLMEWGDPPIIVILSPGRFLCSPGRTRVLAGSGSKRPLRLR